MSSRRRSTPWIHRWSRVIIGAIAILGALLTAYLTVEKLAGSTPTCLAGAGAGGASSCTDVLNSQYATVFNLPLSLFGCLGYTSMATFALAPLAVNSENQKDLRSNLENWTWLLLLAGATAMTVFSGYLMYLLAFEIKALCLYCLASALFSLSFLVLTLIGRSWEDIGQLFFIGIVVGMVTLIGTLWFHANANPPTAPTNNGTIPPVTSSPKPGIGWEITTTSGEAEIALARHLTQVGAKMYGAYWCPHCYDQKQLFGKEAFSQINYIECDPAGKNPQPDICAKAGIKGYPSWEINGKKESGTIPLETLAQLSGYQGSTTFKYKLP